MKGFESENYDTFFLRFRYASITSWHRFVGQRQKNDKCNSKQKRQKGPSRRRHYISCFI